MKRLAGVLNVPIEELLGEAHPGAAMDAAVLGPLMARLAELNDPQLLAAVADELERSAQAAAEAAQRLRQRAEGA